jgi:hypothetical protein
VHAGNLVQDVISHALDEDAGSNKVSIACAHLSEVGIRVEAGSKSSRATSKGEDSLSLLVARRSCVWVYVCGMMRPWHGQSRYMPAASILAPNVAHALSNADYSRPPRHYDLPLSNSRKLFPCAGAPPPHPRPPPPTHTDLDVMEGERRLAQADHLQLPQQEAQVTHSPTCQLLQGRLVHLQTL